MSFGWIVVLILGMFYIGIVIPNQQHLKAIDRVLTTVDKAIDAGLIRRVRRIHEGNRQRDWCGRQE